MPKADPWEGIENAPFQPKPIDDWHLRSGQDAYWTIRPCNDKIENVACACDAPGMHLLHYKKEPLVRYRGKVWAFGCAIADMSYHFADLRNRFEKQVTTNSKLRGLCEENSRRIGEMCKYYKEFTSHKEDCALVEAAMTGRKLDVRCTCGYSYSQGAFITSEDAGK